MNEVKKKSLWKLGNELSDILKKLEDTDPDYEGMSETLQNIKYLDREANNKLEAYVYLVKKWKETIEQIEAERERLKNIKTAAEKNIERMKNMMINFAEITGVNKFDLGLYKIAIQNSPKKTVITDELAIPEKFCREKLVSGRVITKESGSYQLLPDKEKIKKHIVATGDHISGCHLDQEKIVKIY